MDSKSLEHLKERRNSLNRCFMRRKPPENGDSHARILDDYFTDRFSVSHAGFKLDLISNPYAIIATGAYGRNEVFPLPEVRVLFIFRDSIPQGAVELIRDIVYPLWDLGYTVHHSTRTLKEAVAGASADYGTLLSLLDSRFICGVSPLYSRLMSAVREKIVARKKKDILAFIWDRDLLRHKKADGPEYILEPDLMSSPGGWSDIGSMFSALRTVHDTGGFSDLEKTGLFSGRDRENLLNARDFIQNTLVFIQLSGAGDKGRLTLDRQMAAARFFNYKNKGPDKAADFFLTELEKWRSTVSLLRKRLFSHLLPDRMPGFSPEKEVKTQVKWLVISKGFVKITSFSKLRKHPELVLSIFAQGEENHAPVSPDTLGLIAGFREFVPGGFFEEPANMECFEHLLLESEPFGRTLDLLVETGLLFAFIPELKALEHRKVFSWQPSHARLTQALLTVAHLKDSVAEDGARTTDNRRVALWAALLQGVWDENLRTGKSPDAALTVLARFGKTQGFIKRVQNLMGLNKTMLTILHGDDPWDDHAVCPLADRFSTPGELDLLYRLCLAGIRSRASRCFSDFREADLQKAVAALSRMKGWPPPAGLSEPRRERVRPGSGETTGGAVPGIHIHKTASMRQVNLGFPAGMGAVLPVLRALACSGIDFYDLRVFPPENGWIDLVVRARAPRDPMFEGKKWLGFESCLKDPGQGMKGAGAFRIQTDKIIGETAVTVKNRSENGRTVIEIHSPRSFDALPAFITGLESEGISTFYIKNTCCERDFCLVIHADTVGIADEKKVREVIHGIFPA